MAAVAIKQQQDSTATPTPNHGLGFTTNMPHSRESSASTGNGTPHASSFEFQLQDSSDALAFAKRLLSSSSIASEEHVPRCRPTSSSSHEYAYQQFSPEAGPSSPPLRSSSSTSTYGPPQVPPRRRSRGTASIDSRSGHMSGPSGHRHTPSSASMERQALSKLVTMYETLTSEMNAVMSRQSELETNLKIARSNLVLAENHAEALEDTLKRNSSSRLSNGSGTMLGYSPIPPPVPSFSNYASPAGNPSGRANSRSPNPPQGAFNDAHDSESANAPSPILGSFWKRRPTFGTSSHPNLEALSKQNDDTYDPHTGKRSSTSLGINHPNKSVSNATKANHRLSYEAVSEDEGNANLMRRPSFGMLRSSSANIPGNGNDKAQTALINSLQSQLAQSKQTYAVLQAEFQTLQQNHATLSKKYSSLQDEIENLSVSLFEEANTMVAEERKVNSFLNESLDKAKAEADDLQRQVEDLKAALADRDRVTSPALSLKSHRRRTSTSSNHHAHPSRSRRRSSIAALDALESYVASSPRRASRDLAAAAAAVRSLGQSHNSDLPSLPHSASVSSFNKLQLSSSRTRSPSLSLSAPSSAPLPNEPNQGVSHSSLQITTERTEDDFDTIRNRSNAPTRNSSGDADGVSLEVQNQQEDQAPTSASSLRARWFSFGSRRRPKTDAHPVAPQSDSTSPHVSDALNSGTTAADTSRPSSTGEGRLSPRGPPRSPDRSQKHTRLNSSFSPEMFRPGLPAVSEHSMHQSAKSPTVSLSKNVQHLVSPSARPGHARGLSASSLKHTPTSRPSSPFSPAGTDNSGKSNGLNRSLSAFSSPASRRPGTGPRELILLSGGSASSSPRSATHSPRRDVSLVKQQDAQLPRSPVQAAKSPDDSLDIPRSPSQPRYMPVAELHSILDQISMDELPTSFSRLATPSDEKPLTTENAPFAAMQAQLEASPVRAAGSSLRSHKKSWSLSSDRSRSSTLAGDRPHSRNSNTGRSQPQTADNGVSEDISPDAAMPLSINKASHPRLRPIITNAALSKSNSLSNTGEPSAQEPLSSFALPTPPAFKRFPRDAAYRAPLHSPSKSEAMALQRSGSSNLSLSRDLQRSGSTASNVSFSKGFDPSRFGLQRQNSTMSVGTGSVVEDLDSLMKSIDAISESLGLEADGLDASFYEQARASSP